MSFQLFVEGFTLSKFTFKKLDTLGAPDALEDKAVLHECFVDTGYLEALKDLSDSRRIVVGHTGAGKTALMSMVEAQCQDAIPLDPSSLALPHVTNSTILRVLSDLGVNLDIFFKLLWRHVFAVELLKRHCDLNDPGVPGLWDRLLLRLPRKKSNHQAVGYLRAWGESFWQETDYRIKETTQKLEGALESQLGPNLVGQCRGSVGVTSEQKADIVQRAQHVINDVQIRELGMVIDMLDDTLKSEADKYRAPAYYILIDRLDENWVEDVFKYRLIRALIETVRDFQRIERAKIIVALRRDLLDRVFKLTREPGFQEEKYQALYLAITWKKSQLTDVLGRRISYLGKKRVLPQKLKVGDVLPALVDRQPAIDYILDRTLLRPRDVIHFLNLCVARAEGRSEVGVTQLRDAEGEYSRLRLKALADEWSADFPEFMRFVMVLKEQPCSFQLAAFPKESLTEICLGVAVEPPVLRPSEMRNQAIAVAEGRVPVESLVRSLTAEFFRMGLVGLKLESFEAVSWSHEGRHSVSSGEIDDQTRIHIHPAFYRSLGIVQRQ